MNTTPTFNVLQTPLKGKTLIEASAGTGKTYSIAILVLRMIVEQQLSIEKILIVTFTKAAVAELQARIRRFIKEAHRYASGTNIDDELIKKIIDNSNDISAVKDRLQHTLYLMDEANILTIHSFSFQILNQFAFETAQPFNIEMQEDISDIIDNVINIFWRKEITQLPVKILELMDLKQYKKDLKELFKSYLSGVQYLPLLSNPNIITNTPEKTNNIEILNDYLYKSLPENNDLEKVNYQPNSFEWLNKIEESSKINLTNHLYVFLNSIAITDYVPLVSLLKTKAEVYTFDDVINKLHKAVVKQHNPHLLNIIRNNYKAVCIDEFQDTDIIQFQIFEKLFIEDKDATLFLIGDPKQSIYAFRSADVDSYLQAKSKVDRWFSMSTNFRSTTEMIQSSNAFFESISDTFAYKNKEMSISYEVVTAHNTKAHLYKNGEIIHQALTLNAYKNKDLVLDNLAAQVSAILHPENNYSIIDKTSKQQRSIRPSDIGILVTSKKDGKKIKNELQKLNIPSIQILDEKVLDTDEAKEMIMILEAINLPSKSNLKKVMYATFLKPQEVPIEQMKDLDFDNLQTMFKGYQQLSQSGSLYETLEKILNDFSIRQHFTSSTENLRKLANINQIIQIILEQQQQKNMNIDDIIFWMQNSNNFESRTSSNDYTTQIESDEDAVKIVTIHSSKGLEYNIVFVQGLETDPTSSSKVRFLRYKSENTGNVFSDKSLLTKEQKEQFELQNLQERRRLLYVAITRAVYQCNIFYSSHKKNTVLSEFEKTNQSTNSITWNKDEEIESHHYHEQKNATKISVLIPNINVLQNSKSYWWKMSYTALDTAHDTIQYNSELSITNNDYDEFIFSTLKKGASVGILLHSLFEHIEFKNYNSEDVKLEYWLNAFNEISSTGKTINNAEFIKQLVHHTIHAFLKFNDDEAFILRDIEPQKQLSELEFNFSINAHDWQNISQYLQEHKAYIKYNTDRFPEGLMNGKIDLFFEHKGKYYILDWKSNYIGNTLEQYNKEGVADAMTHSNYHLQYLIYTVAVHKYLRSRLPNYDYENHFGGVAYLFLRGLREHSDTGIFTSRPEYETILHLEKLLNDKN